MMEASRLTVLIEVLDFERLQEANRVAALRVRTLLCWECNRAISVYLLLERKIAVKERLLDGPDR